MISEMRVSLIILQHLKAFSVPPEQRILQTILPFQDVLLNETKFLDFHLANPSSITSFLNYLEAGLCLIRDWTSAFQQGFDSLN